MEFDYELVMTVVRRGRVTATGTTEALTKALDLESGGTITIDRCNWAETHIRRVFDEPPPK